MLNRLNIHNSAILKPSYCKSMQVKKRHDFVAAKNYEQCIECGKINREKTNGLRTRQLHDTSSRTNLFK